MIYENVLQTIGRTPIVRLNCIAPPHIALYVKLERFNPSGSVKDRPAVAMILSAEQDGRLRPGQTVIEATSGNTGISLAMICASRGYPFVAIMPDKFSVERRKLIRAYGGKVILTPSSEPGSDIHRAEALACKHGWFLARQFENPANLDSHRNTTAAEILGDFAGRRLDYFVSGWGTGGTLSGVAEVLKLTRPDTRIIAAEPANAAVLSGKEWQPHGIQGWTPKIPVPLLNRTVIDEVLAVDETVALDLARLLATKEGILAGISSGATLAAALQIATAAPQGSVLLAMLPDTGERYLTTEMFAGIAAGSDDDWLAQLELIENA
jgi:cysteine synthase A